MKKYKFFITFRSVLPRIINVPDKSSIENQNTYFMFSPPPPPENYAGYEIMRKNIVEPKRPQMAICHTCIACWIPKATDIHSEYVRLTAFPLQQWVHKRASVLRYTYIACLVILLVSFHIAINCEEFCLERDER